MNSILDMKSIDDFIILGAAAGCIGYIVFNILTSSVPGISGMVAPTLAGAVLGAILYVFSTGIAHG